MGERIKQLIDTLRIKRSEFAKRLNLSQPFVSELCSGTKNPSDRTIADICREFHVSFDWLMTGNGEMFEDLPEGVIDEIATQYGLDNQDRKLIIAYLNLSREERLIIKKFLNTLSGQ